jgi:hypothetical protein
MAIPENNGIFDTTLNKIIAPTSSTWSDLRSTIEIVISSISDANVSVANLIAGNVAFGNVTITNTTMGANSNVIVLGTTTANIANLSVGMQVYRANIAGNVGNITAIQNSSTGVRWDTYKTWTGTPAQYLIYSTPIIDVGSVGYFNLEIDADINGNVKYEIRSSTTGTFDGTETLTNVFPATDNIPAFYGRYVVVTANVAYDGSLQTISTLSARNFATPFAIYLDSIDTGTLPQLRPFSRHLELGRNTSHITNIQATVKNNEEARYVDISYVDILSNYMQNSLSPYSGTDVPILTIRDKYNGGANITVIQGGGYTDAVFDILVYALPEQFMDGINLRQR